MKIELKRISYSERLSEETNAFAADVYIDGKKVAYAKNDGHGGCTFIHPFPGMRAELEKAEAYCKTLPKYLGKYEMNLETKVDELLEEELGKRFMAKVRKKQDKHIILMHKTKPGMFLEYGYGKGKNKRMLRDLPADKVKAEVADLLKENPDYKLFNDNINEDGTIKP